MVMENSRALAVAPLDVLHVPEPSVSLPSLFTDRSLTDDERHIVAMTHHDLVEMAAMTAKEAYAAAAVEQLMVAVHSCGMRGTAQMLATQQGCVGEEVRAYSEAFTQQMIVQLQQYSGAIAGMGARRIAEIASRPSPPRPAPAPAPARSWLARLLEG